MTSVLVTPASHSGARHLRPSVLLRPTIFATRDISSARSPITSAYPPGVHPSDDRNAVMAPTLRKPVHHRACQFGRADLPSINMANGSPLRLALLKPTSSKPGLAFRYS